MAQPQPPVTLADVREFLNFDVGDTSHDAEVWDMAIAATEAVEARVGAMVARDVNEVIRTDSGGLLELSDGPVTSLTLLTLDGVEVDLTTLDVDLATGLVESTGARLCGSYDVTYRVGYDVVPESLKQAVLLITEQLFKSQRGPSTTSRFAGNAGSASDDSTWRYKGFLWPRRAEQLAAPYRNLGGIG